MDDNLLIRIDSESPQPAYRQIVDALRAHIVEGRLRPEDRLPTVRELAVDLMVHHNTVAQAYRELAAEGWLELRRRRGAVVQSREDRRPRPEAPDRFERHLRELVAKAQSDGLQPRMIMQLLGRVVEQLKEEPS